MLKYIIINRTDSIGDVVLTLPLCGIIKELDNNNEYKIIFLGQKYTEPVIGLSKFVDGFLDWKEIKNIKPKQFKSTFLQYNNIDTILHIYPRKEISKYFYKAGIKKRVGTSHRIYNLFFCNKRLSFSRKKSNLHESELNLHFLKALNLPHFKNDKPLWQYYGFENLPVLERKTYIEENYIKKGQINIILHPKSKGSAREWPLDKYKKLVQKLKASDNKKYNIIISGTEPEKALLQTFLENVKGDVVDATGQLSLQEFIYLIYSADILVACSTGPLHIASALGKKAIGIYPSIKPMHAGRWGPIGEKAIAISNNVDDCTKCKKSKHCECISEIPVEQIVNAIAGSNG